MEHKKDHCTGFYEYWYRWKNWYSWEKVDISDCCEIHDKECSTKAFIECLKEKRIVGRYVITLVAATACLIRYGKV